MEEQLHLHRWEQQAPKINVKVEKNSKSINYEVSVIGAISVDEAVKLIREAMSQLKNEFAVEV